jgi:ribulose-phosphate 3-epimerase
MAIVCPTVTAFTEHDYKEQILRLKPFAQRIHIDLMDGIFAPTISPSLDHIWWPHEVEADIHLMYQEPMDYLDALIRLKPRMVVIHNEAHVHHMHFAAELHRHDILTGLAVLRDTPIEYAYQIMHSFDHILVFSGDLGHHGGHADLGLLDKVTKIKARHPDAEIGWDGGINDEIAPQLIAGGVQVLNVGGFIQKADDPAAMYNILNEMV